MIYCEYSQQYLALDSPSTLLKVLENPWNFNWKNSWQKQTNVLEKTLKS